MSTTTQRSLLLHPLTSQDDLHRWVKLFCNLDVPRLPVCPGHAAPFDYLVRAYFEPASDQVVHAPRGGGKTRLAAVATLLDLLHKPGISIRILGGSLEQAMRMWEHLLPDLSHAARELMKRRLGSARRIDLTNGSSVAVLTQSERSVRGIRVQKLRCDEVELFKPAVWEAAQLVTKSRKLVVGSSQLAESPSSRVAQLPTPNYQLAHGAIDALSTHHNAFGLMQQILDNAQQVGTPIVRWCLIDVLERCPADRECANCPLFDDCGGVAKTRCNGFVSIDDAIRMKRRVSADVWQSEMLCRRPSVKHSVFAGFDPHVHVRESVSFASTPTMSLAIDFGFAAPFVCLWIQTDGRVTHVLDVYAQPQRTIDEHLDVIRSRAWQTPTYIACDPAGNGRNDQTGASNVQRLRHAGYPVRFRASRIQEGVESIRAALSPAAGEPTLFVHPRCTPLIRAMSAYHYSPTPDARSELPVKDGEHDHFIDALRYHFANLTKRTIQVRRY